MPYENLHNIDINVHKRAKYPESDGRFVAFIRTHKGVAPAALGDLVIFGDAATISRTVTNLIQRHAHGQVTPYFREQIEPLDSIVVDVYCLERSKNRDEDKLMLQTGMEKFLAKADWQLDNTQKLKLASDGTNFVMTQTGFSIHCPIKKAIIAQHQLQANAKSVIDTVGLELHFIGEAQVQVSKAADRDSGVARSSDSNSPSGSSANGTPSPRLFKEAAASEPTKVEPTAEVRNSI